MRQSFDGLRATLRTGPWQVGNEVSYPLEGGRHAWVQVLKGTVTVNGTPLGTSDGAAVSEETALRIKATEEAEILLFDLA